MATLTPIPNIGSQLERAIIAWLYAAYGGAYQIGSFYFSNDWKDRVPPLVDVFAHRSAETVKHSRIESYQVILEWKWPGANQPGQTNADFNWKSINDFVGVGMAAMSQSDDGGETYRAAAMQIAQAGRRLAVLGTAAVAGATADDLANNADLKDFYCDYLEFKGSQRGVVSGGELFLKEIRNFEIHACNLVDDSIFPDLTFALGALSWTFSGTLPAYWLIESSADGLAWTTLASVAGNVQTEVITGSGTQYWRVRQSADGVNGIDPESNLLKVTGA